jgi:hypothetical protein
LTRFVGARAVMQALDCSRSTAYEHLRRASGRLKAQKGLLRVAVAVWERYAAQTFGAGEVQPTPRNKKDLDALSFKATDAIRITRPRTRPRAQREP